MPDRQKSRGGRCAGSKSAKRPLETSPTRPDQAGETRRAATERPPLSTTATAAAHNRKRPGRGPLCGRTNVERDRAGVLVTINSDDPAYFGGYVNANYRAVQDAFDLTTPDLAALAKASFAASWLEPAEKATKIEEVQLYLQRLNKARAAPTGYS